MWQTMLNGLTFHPNFAREVRAGRLRAGDSPRGRWAFAIDSVVTVLGAPLVLLLSAPLRARRGARPPRRRAHRDARARRRASAAC